MKIIAKNIAPKNMAGIGVVGTIVFLGLVSAIVWYFSFIYQDMEARKPILKAIAETAPLREEIAQNILNGRNPKPDRDISKLDSRYIEQTSSKPLALEQRPSVPELRGHL